MHEPFDLAAETAVLGSVFLEPVLYHKISTIISTDDFYDPRNREIWSAMGECIRSGQLDLVTLNAKLSERNTIDNIGMEYIVAAVNTTPSYDGAEEYANIVSDYGRRRRLMKDYADAYHQLSDLSVSVSDVNAFINQAINVPDSNTSCTMNFRQAFDKFSRDYKEREKRGTELPGISMGYRNLDHALGGLEKSKLYVVAGRPGMGKTAFAICVALNIAEKGKTVLFFSMEMNIEQIMKRMSSIWSNIPGNSIKYAKLSDEEKKQLSEMRNAFPEDNILINDKPAQTLASITSVCMAENARLNAIGKKIDCIIIDHVHILSSPKKSADRRIQIGEASRDSKILAGTMKCPVVLLAQLSRAGRDRQDKRPLLTDLKESGDLEQDADAVLFLHREGYYSPDTADQTEAEVIIAKNRDGYVGKIDFYWDTDCTKFIEYSGGKKGESEC